MNENAVTLAMTVVSAEIDKLTECGGSTNIATALCLTEALIALSRLNKECA